MKEELYKRALGNVHRYSLLNEIFAIRDERFIKEQQDSMLCVNGYIGIDTLNRYVRNIDELVEYQNIDTIENLKEKDKEIDRLNNIINELEKWCNETMKKYKLPLVEQNKGALGFTLPIQDAYQQVLNKLKELKENK